MRVLVQRARDAKVTDSGKLAGEIKEGLMLLVGFTQTDTEKEIDWMVNKVINLRIFDDENGVMNKSILDLNYEILSISQFTLYADTKKGRRPSYINALSGDLASKLYDSFNLKLSKYVNVSKGIFGSDMKVSILNDGPVTIVIESGDIIAKK